MHLVFDFDGTITEQDTIGELASGAIALQHARHGDGGDNDLKAAWDDVVRCYVDDWRAYKDAYRVPEAERSSADQELPFLRGMKASEEVSLARVAASGVFSGLSATDLFDMGLAAAQAGKVVVRDGFAELVEVARRRGWKTAVVSVNWSAAFIRGVLHPLDMPVFSNDVSAAGGGIEGPGILVPDGGSGGGAMTNSEDKRRCLERVLGLDGGTAERTLYFGDSTTDLECLLFCGGVAISAAPTTDDKGTTAASSLVQTLRRLGSPVPHVASVNVNGPREQRAAIAWARDFYEVLKSGILPA